MTTAQIRAIEKHGNNLLAIFPHATEKEPLELCRKLRRLEGRAHAFALQLCNGPELSEERQDKITEMILNGVNALLNFRADGIPVFLNRDPRGYALKINDEWLRKLSLETLTNKYAPLHRDWGGYGIIAPEIGKDGH